MQEGTKANKDNAHKINSLYDLYEPADTERDFTEMLSVKQPISNPKLSTNVAPASSSHNPSSSILSKGLPAKPKQHTSSVAGKHLQKSKKPLSKTTHKPKLSEEEQLKKELKELENVKGDIFDSPDLPKKSAPNSLPFTLNIQDGEVIGRKPNSNYTPPAQTAATTLPTNNRPNAQKIPQSPEVITTEIDPNLQNLAAVQLKTPWYRSIINSVSSWFSSLFSSSKTKQPSAPAPTAVTAEPSPTYHSVEAIKNQTREVEADMNKWIAEHPEQKPVGPASAKVLARRAESDEKSTQR